MTPIFSLANAGNVPIMFFMAKFVDGEIRFMNARLKRVLKQALQIERRSQDGDVQTRAYKIVEEVEWMLESVEEIEKFVRASGN